MAISRWYAESARVIQGVLDHLPVELTPAEVRARVSAAYPFGARKNRPYRMWLKAVNDLLGRRPKPKDSPRPGRIDLVRRFAERPSVPWLLVYCWWCDSQPAGCMMCAKLHRTVLQITDDELFRALKRHAEADPVGWLILRDWLAEKWNLDVEVPAP